MRLHAFIKCMGCTITLKGNEQLSYYDRSNRLTEKIFNFWRTTFPNIPFSLLKSLLQNENLPEIYDMILYFSACTVQEQGNKI